MNITQPSVVELADGYNFMWLEGVEEWLWIDIHQIRPAPNNTLTAEITVYILLGERNIFENIRFNLMTARDRRDIAVRLHEMYLLGEVQEWLQIIDQVCTETIKRHREVEPAISLKDIPEREIPRYRLYPFIFEQEINILFGDGDTGKTILACLTATLVQDGYSVLKLTPEPGNVLYLDWETNQYQIKEAVTAIRKGLQVTLQESNPDILYMHCDQLLADMIEEIRLIVQQHDIKLMVVDSIGLAVGGDADKMESARAGFSALRSLNVTVLGIDHIAKGSDGSAPYGSVYRRNIPRSQFLVKHDQAPETYELNIALIHKKCNIAPKLKPFGLKLNFSMNGTKLDEIHIDSVDLASNPELAKSLSLTERITSLLRQGAISVSEIAEGLEGSNENSIRTALNRAKGHFIKVNDNKWGLKSYEEI